MDSILSIAATAAGLVFVVDGGSTIARNDVLGDGSGRGMQSTADCNKMRATFKPKRIRLKTTVITG
jgi:hypothetical protein